MPAFYALVDAVPGQEAAVRAGLGQLERLNGVVPCREKSHDFLVRFDAEGFDVVDDFLQSHVRPLRGVKAVEIVTDFDDHGAAVREARDRLV